MNKVLTAEELIEAIIWHYNKNLMSVEEQEMIDVVIKKYKPVLEEYKNQSSVSAYSIDVVKELLRKQREICANRARADEDHYRGRFRGCVLNKNEILNAPEPELPQSSVSDEEDLEPSKEQDSKPVARKKD
jgi:type I site-specific restriction endonuclease